MIHKERKLNNHEPIKMVTYYVLNSFKSIDVTQLAKKYQSIYAHSPWGEWKICSSDTCHKYWGIEDKPVLEKLNFKHCNKPVLDYWPIDFLLEKFKSLEKRQLTLIIAKDDVKNEIIGFCWGYIKSKEDFKERIFSGRAPNFIPNMNLFDGQVSYLSEIAVAPNYREKGFGKSLLNLYTNQQKNTNWVFTQTKGGKNPSISYKWFQNLGFYTSDAFNKKSMVVQILEISSLISKLKKELNPMGLVLRDNY